VIPLPDQVQISCEGNDVYTFQPFGNDSCVLGCNNDALVQIDTSAGMMRVCRRCSSVRFVPHERGPIYHPLTVKEWRFDRYRDGHLKAQGVKVHAVTEPEAWAAARSLLHIDGNRPTDVLVLDREA
jgi:hypothetical protein